MSTRLFTIGDSISQGFMSAAAAQTELSYSTLLARQLGIPKNQYFFPGSSVWKHGGLPGNLEVILRLLEDRCGTNIRGFEWLTVIAALKTYADTVEEYYERGAGSETKPTPDGRAYYHNVAVRGFDVANSWNMTSAIALDSIQQANRKSLLDDGFLSLPNASFYRTAKKVLNPDLSKKFADFSALSWLDYHITELGGVDNLCLWLGANNALSTVLKLEIKQTPGDGSPVGMSHAARDEAAWNLWHPIDFAAEYQELLNRVDASMRTNKNPNWKVFVATVPLVSIAPLLKGVGPTTEIDGDTYYKYYTYFPFSEEFAHKNDVHLTINQVLHIDNCIRAYNKFIVGAVDSLNATYGNSTHYYVVDMAKALNDMAWKRNAAKPTYQFPSYFDFIYPRVDTKYYHASQKGTIKQGGIFSIDGVHPTAIGQGLIAHEFIKVMQQAGVAVSPFSDADWATIFATDTLYSSPIKLMGELYEHEKLADLVIRAINYFKD